MELFPQKINGGTFPSAFKPDCFLSQGATPSVLHAWVTRAVCAEANIVARVTTARVLILIIHRKKDVKSNNKRGMKVLLQMGNVHTL